MDASLQSSPKACPKPSKPQRKSEAGVLYIPVSSTLPADDDVVLSSPAAAAPRHKKLNRSKSEPNAYVPMSCTLPADDGVVVRRSPRQAGLPTKLSRSKSEPGRQRVPECNVLRAYREALSFHGQLCEDYETAKRLFVLHRYRRIRRLVRSDAVEQQLNQLRRAKQYECSCGVRSARVEADGPAESVDGGADGKLEELVEAVRPTFDRVKAIVQSAWGCVGTLFAFLLIARRCVEGTICRKCALCFV